MFTTNIQHIKVAHNLAQMQILTWFNRALKEHLLTNCDTGINTTKHASYCFPKGRWITGVFPSSLHAMQMGRTVLYFFFSS